MKNEIIVSTKGGNKYAIRGQVGREQSSYKAHGIINLTEAFAIFESADFDAEDLVPLSTGTIMSRCF